MLDNDILIKAIKRLCESRPDKYDYKDSYVNPEGHVFALYEAIQDDCLCIAWIMGTEGQKLSKTPIPKLNRQEYEDALDWFLVDWIGFVDNQGLDIRLDHVTVNLIRNREGEQLASIRLATDVLRRDEVFGKEVAND